MEIGSNPVNCQLKTGTTFPSMHPGRQSGRILYDLRLDEGKLTIGRDYVNSGNATLIRWNDQDSRLIAACFPLLIFK